MYSSVKPQRQCIKSWKRFFLKQTFVSDQLPRIECGSLVFCQKLFHFFLVSLLFLFEQHTKQVRFQLSGMLLKIITYSRVVGGLVTLSLSLSLGPKKTIFSISTKPVRRRYKMVIFKFIFILIPFSANCLLSDLGFHKNRIVIHPRPHRKKHHYEITAIRIRAATVSVS